jgi:hypothetical protein
MVLRSDRAGALLRVRPALLRVRPALLRVRPALLRVRPALLRIRPALLRRWGMLSRVVHTNTISSKALKRRNATDITPWR